MNDKLSSEFSYLLINFRLFVYLVVPIKCTKFSYIVK